MAQQLAVVLGPPVRLDGRRRRVGVDGVGRGDAEHRAGGGVHHLADAGVLTAAQQGVGPADVDRLEELLVPGERHLRDIVEHDVHAVAGLAYGVDVADVAAHELDAARPVVGVVQVEHPHRPPLPHELGHQQRAEVAAAPGHQGGSLHRCLLVR
jgi:hypothetical protein